MSFRILFFIHTFKDMSCLRKGTNLEQLRLPDQKEYVLPFYVSWHLKAKEDQSFEAL